MSYSNNGHDCTHPAATESQTRYEMGQRVRVRTITSEMEAVIVGEPERGGAHWTERPDSWYADTLGADSTLPDEQPIRRRILGRVGP